MGLAPKTVRELARRGELPALRFGPRGHWLSTRRRSRSSFVGVAESTYLHLNDDDLPERDFLDAIDASAVARTPRGEQVALAPDESAALL